MFLVPVIAVVNYVYTNLRPSLKCLVTAEDEVNQDESSDGE